MSCEWIDVGFAAVASDHPAGAGNAVKLSVPVCAVLHHGLVQDDCSSKN